MDEATVSSDDESAPRQRLDSKHRDEHYGNNNKHHYQDNCDRFLRSVRHSNSASSLVHSSRRGSIVVSPTNGDLKVGIKPHSKAHVKFHTQNGVVVGSCTPSTPPGTPTSSDSSSVGQFSEGRAPDGGWGWVVVIASFLVNLVADGITFSFGVIFVELNTYFGEGKSKTAWIGSLFMAMPLLSGPIASFLTDRYGCRKCCIVGGITAAIGFVLSAFTTSLELLFLTFGIISGFGLSLCYVAAVVIVAYYFDSKRSFATGLSVCGSGIGTFIFAPAIQYLLVEYGWRGTVVILAGCFLNLCVCGMLMRDLEWTKAKRKKLRRARVNTASSADSYSAQSGPPHTPTSCPSIEEIKRLLQKPGMNISEVEVPIAETEGEEAQRLCSSLVNLPTFIRNGEKVPLEVLEMLTTHKHLYHVLLQNYPHLLVSSNHTISEANECSLSEDLAWRLERLCSEVELQGEPGRASANMCQAKFLSAHANGADSAFISDTGPGGGDPWWLKPHTQRKIPTAAYLKDLRVHRHSLTYRGAMLNINRYRLRASSCPDIYRNSMTTIAKEKSEWYSGLSDLWSVITDMLDFSHFGNIRFLLFAISNFLLYTWYDVPYVYLIDYAIEENIAEDASMLVSLTGIFNMMGEIILGWMGDREEVNANMVYAQSMALCGIVVAIIPLLKTYWSLSVASGAFGLFIAANYSLTSIILVELISLERFTNAYGLLLLVQGVANLIGPPIAGWLFDVYKFYDLSFYLGGFFIALSGALLVVLPAIEKFQEWRRQPEKLEQPNKV